MNKLAGTLGIILIGLSFYSIGPELCNVFSPGCIGSEHYRAVLPYFLVILLGGIMLLAASLKSLSLWSFTKDSE